MVNLQMILTVAEILNRNTASTIQGWLNLLQNEEEMTSVPMGHEQRCSHLPQVFRELISRLKTGSKGTGSVAAAKHGLDRRRQGYSAAMLVQESRMLEVSIFQTLQEHRASVDFSSVLDEVTVIADEIDSQLSQAIASYTAESSPAHT